MLPKQSELELPILEVLVERGGTATPDQVYEGVKRHFPQLTEADLLLTQPSGDNKFQNTIRWTRQRLIDTGEMHSPGYGRWGITERGKKRLEGDRRPRPALGPAAQPPTLIPNGPTPPGNLEEAFSDYVDAFTRRVIQALLDLSAEQFELFARELLTAYGFLRMRVTNSSTAPDGGIDGSGELRVGLAILRAAFQCKRWKGQVGRPEVDKFRGAIQGQYEHGYFFTTSTFSDEARQASVRPGTVPIFLFDGREIVAIMIERGLGIARRPLEIYEDRIEALFEKK